MSFLSNIKFQYNLKILKDDITVGNLNSFFEKLQNHKNNKRLYTQLLFNLGLDAIKKTDENFFLSKITWLNSFLEDDLDYIEKFVKFYFQTHGEKFNINSYEEETLYELNQLQQIKEINFNDFVNFSYLYQYLILQKQKSNNIFLKNYLPYFSSPNQLNFSNTSMTRCFLYILDHPYRVYQKIKNNFDGDQNLARNIFLNLDDQKTIKNVNNVDVEINKKGWHTHANSWTGSNVLNVHRGKVILKSELITNTFDTLSSVVLHLIQSGVSIELNYETINGFISTNPISQDTVDINLSQKEKKFIDQYVSDIASSYNFDY